MASDVLNRVGMLLSEVGSSYTSVVASTLISNRYNTPAEAGAVDGASYWWMIEEDNDYMIFEGSYTASETRVMIGTIWHSKIGGVHGTSKMTLAGNATLRSPTPAEAIAQLARLDKPSRFTGSLQASGGFPAAGAGVEIAYSASNGYVRSYDHGSSSWKPLTVGGSTLTLETSGTARLSIDGSGNTVISATTPSTSTTVGALVVGGGAAVGGAGNFGGSINAPAMNVGGAIGAPWINAIASYECGVSGTWLEAIKGPDRGQLYLLTGGTNLFVAYYTQGTTSNNVGSIALTTTGTAFNTTSDGRKKPLRRSVENALDTICELRPYLHNWINDPEKWSHGLVAQEAYAIYPDAVSVGDDNPNLRPGDDGFESWSIDYAKFTPLLIAALQELRSELALLRGS